MSARPAPRGEGQQVEGWKRRAAEASDAGGAKAVVSDVDRAAFAHADEHHGHGVEENGQHEAGISTGKSSPEACVT